MRHLLSHAKQRVPFQIPKKLVGMVHGIPARPALAAHVRSLSHLALRNHAATDACRGGHSLLRTLPRAISHRRTTRQRTTGRSAPFVVGTRLLLASAQSAKSCTRDRSEAQWCFPKRARRGACVARHRRVHGRGNPEHRLPEKTCRVGRKRCPGNSTSERSARRSTRERNMANSSGERRSTAG